MRLDVRRALASEQRDLFRSALGDLSAAVNGQVDELVAQFDLPVKRIRAATAEAVDGQIEDGEEIGRASCRERVSIDV